MTGEAAIGPRGWAPRKWFIAGMGLALVLSAIGFMFLKRPAPVYPGAVTAVIVVPLLALGGLISAKRPGERMGSILVIVGACGAVMIGAGEYAAYSELGLERASRLPFTGAAGWISSVIQSGLVIGLVAIVLLFPTGRLLSARWRPVAWALALGLLGGSLTEAFGGPRFNSNLDFMRNPLYLAHVPAVIRAAVTVLDAASLVGLVGAIAQLIVRLRRSRGDEHLQLKWFAYAGVVGPLLVLVPTFANATNGILGSIVWTVGPLIVILAVGVSVLKYRLYDIDVVINKTLVYGLLAAFITAVYVAIVVGIGAAVGQGSQPNLGLSIAATAVVAVAFQPVRHGVQGFANRLVYGERATPYEVLSSFSERVAGDVGGEEILVRMARTLGEATGAATAGVWLVEGAQLRTAASWPEGGRGAPPVRLPEAPADPLPIEATLALPVRHQDELLGAISLIKPAGERLRPAEEQLTRDLASQAGLVLHNVRLTTELRARLEELSASRRRLVSAQDAARRRLERNIHDGAQQQLVALSVKTNLARQLLTRDPDRAESMLHALRADVDRATEDLAELARGTVPAALTELGLVEALRAQSARGVVPVRVEAPATLPELPAGAEAAAYFCVLEALQNVSKYAGASRAVVRLSVSDGGELRFEVDDDGRGFDASATSYGTGLRGIAERLAALDGTLEVSSVPGHGTTVVGRIPVHALEPVP
jgi:signal transduction histidine kinase